MFKKSVGKNLSRQQVEQDAVFVQRVHKHSTATFDRITAFFRKLKNT